ncbi:hypothetical protein J7K99_03920 [bacterium]|nr:hypothetical protein [bacterium]
MKQGLGLLFLFAVLFAVPHSINYQGKITNSSGVALDGTYDMVFRLYDVSTGGTALWSETHSSVNVHRGLFDVLLGETNPINLPFDGQYYLEIEVEGEVLTPRIPLNSVGYAFRAANADSVNWSGIQGVPAGFADGTDDVDDADSDPTNELQTIVAGNGLTGGGSGSSIALNVVAGRGIGVAADSVYHLDMSSQSSVDNGGGTVIQDVLLDYTGHVTSLVSTNLDNRYHTGSGTSNYVPKWTGTRSLGNSEIYDDGTKVGIGTTSPGSKLHILTTKTNQYSASGPGYLISTVLVDNDNPTSTSYPNQYAALGFHVQNVEGGNNAWGYLALVQADAYNDFGDFVFVLRPSGGGSPLERMRITSDGNVGIGASSPSERLVVAGDVDIMGSVDIQNPSFPSEVDRYIGAGSSWVVPAGVWVCTAGWDDVFLQVYVDGGWHSGANKFGGGTVISDGSKVRFYNSGSYLREIWCLKLGN